MSLQVYCPACKKTYAVPQDAAGKRMRCPNHHLVAVPAAPARPAAAAPPEPEAAASASRAVLVGVAAGGLLALLLLCGGGVGLFLYLHEKPGGNAVAQVSSTEPSRAATPLDGVRPGGVATGTDNEGSAGGSIQGGGDNGDKPTQPPPDPKDEPVPGQPPPQLGRVGAVDFKARIVVEHPLPARKKDSPPVPDVWDGHTNHVRGVAYTDDGQFVVSVSGDVYPEKPPRPHDFSIRLWDVRWGRQVHKVEGFGEPLKGVSVAPGGRYAVFGHGGHWTKDSEWVDSTDHSVRLFDIQLKKEVPLEEVPDGNPGAGKAEGRFRGLNSSVFGTAISPDNTRISGGANSGKLILWDAKTGKVQIDGQVPSVGFIHGLTCVAFTPDDRYLVVVSADYKLRLFDARTGQAGAILGNHLDIVWALAVAKADGRVLALSGGGSRQRLDGKGFMDGAKDYAIRLWDLYQGQEVRRFVGHDGDVMGLAFCPNGRHFVSGSRDKTVRLWDLATGRQLRVLGRHDAPLRSVAVAPDGRTAVSGGDDCKVRFWHLPARGDDLAAAFKTNDLAAVQKAVADLDTMGPDALRAYPEVVKALTHSDPKFRDSATQALTWIAEDCQKNNARPDPPLVAELVGALKSAEGTDRRYAVALTLAAIGPAAKEAVPALCDLVSRAGDVKVVATAVKALGKIGDPSAAPALETALRHADGAVRGSAAAALLSFGPESVKLKTFLDLLQTDTNAEVRTLAEKGLRAKLPSLTTDDVPPLRGGLKSDKPAVCIYCADGVAKVGAEAKDAVPELTGLLQAGDRDVRLHAVLALQGVGEAARSALPGLERLLTEDGEKDRRVSAAAALAILKLDPSTRKDKLIDLLVKGLKPEKLADLDDPGARALAEQCRGALVEIGRPATKPLLKALEFTYRPTDVLNTEARANVYQALAKLKGKANTDDAPQILNKCRDREKELVKRTLPDTPDGALARKVYELAKKAFDCVYNDKD